MIMGHTLKCTNLSSLERTPATNKIKSCTPINRVTDLMTFYNKITTLAYESRSKYKLYLSIFPIQVHNLYYFKASNDN